MLPRYLFWTFLIAICAYALLRQRDEVFATCQYTQTIAERHRPGSEAELLMRQRTPRGVTAKSALLEIDQEARRLGVTRQAFIKVRLADSLVKSH